MHMKNIILILLLSFINIGCFATTIPQPLLSNSKQLILVMTQHLNEVTGTLQRYTRPTTKGSWKKVGKSVPVVVGKAGMGWNKKEGDNLTPIGIYRIGPMFGFDEQSDYPIKDTTVCVDDVNSIYYNQIIDSANVIKHDWHSGEQMRQIPLYNRGAVIQYNTAPIIRGAGSCIFLHSWRNSHAGTAGCIAIEASHLKEMLDWMSMQDNPVIAIMAKPIYGNMKSTWHLP